MKLHLAEINRRGVFKTLVAYAIASWVLIEVTDVIGGAFLLPEWFVAALTTVLVLGAFPVVLLSWRYDITWEGIKRDTSRVTDEVDRSARRISALLVLLLLTITSALWINYFRSHSENELEALIAAQQGAPQIGEDGSITRIAVLPFDDFSPDGDKQWVADSIADAILHELAQSRDLIVTAKTSSFGFRGSDKTAAEIGVALGVQALLEGSVQVVGDRLRVTSQFVRTSDQAHIWSDVSEATMEDWFEIQDSIAWEIRDLVLPHSQPRVERADHTKPPSLEAYRLLMVGKGLVGDEESNDEAIKLIETIVEIWPDYADAWAWLAEAYYNQIGILHRSHTARNTRIEEYEELKEQALDRALQLDPENPTAMLRSSWASGKMLHETIDQVFAMAPNDPALLENMGGGALYALDYKLAESTLRRARGVDPADYGILEFYLFSICGQGTAKDIVEQQLANYPTSPVEAAKMRAEAAFCDADYIEYARQSIERARLDRKPAAALEALFLLVNLGQEEALAQIGVAQRVHPMGFNPENPALVLAAYFSSDLAEREESWRLARDADFGGHFPPMVIGLLTGEYEQAEQFADAGLRGWEAWYRDMDMVWHMQTLPLYAYKAWLLQNRDEQQEAMDLVARLMQALEDKELSKWSDSRGRIQDIPLMILLLGGETERALDWLADAEKSRWLAFQPLLTSPVYAEFRQLPEVAAALERMVAWRTALLDELRTLGLPEVEDPGLLVDYLAATTRPTHHELARMSLHFDDDLAGALGHYERALEENPENTEIIGQTADLALELGLVDEAVRLFEHAVTLSPNNAGMHYWLAVTYGHAARWQDAINSATTALELKPEAQGMQRWLGQMLLMDGQPEQAEKTFMQIENETARKMGMIMAHHALGRHAESDALLAEWLESDLRKFSPWQIAYVHAFRGEADLAFQKLELCILDPAACSGVGTFPMFLNLHDDPRWLPFLESMGRSPEQLAGIEFSFNLPRR